MLVRIRWFLLGALGAFGGSAYVVAKLLRMRARLTPGNVARASALAVSDALAWAARRIAPRSPQGMDG